MKLNSLIGKCLIFIQIRNEITKYLLSIPLAQHSNFSFIFSVNTSSPMSTSSLDDVDTVSGDGEQMVIKTQPELPKYAQQPMPIGEKINLKFEVSCGRPLLYEWRKQGVREDVTSSASSASSSRSALTPVSNGRELVGEVVEGGEGITSWQYICRAFCPSTGE